MQLQIVAWVFLMYYSLSPLYKFSLEMKTIVSPGCINWRKNCRSSELDVCYYIVILKYGHFFYFLVLKFPAFALPRLFFSTSKQGECSPQKCFFHLMWCLCGYVWAATHPGQCDNNDLPYPMRNKLKCMYFSGLQMTYFQLKFYVTSLCLIIYFASYDALIMEKYL